MECFLRQWRIEDAADLAAAIDNQNVQDNLRDGLPYPYTESDAVDFIRSMLAAEKDSVFSFAIVVKDKVVGSIGAFRKENIHSKTAEIGYYIAEPYWGRGIGTSAVKQICEYVFEHTDIIPALCGAVCPKRRFLPNPGKERIHVRGHAEEQRL